jgi:hypothetical protein
VAPRTRAERRRDVEHRLRSDIDAWVATSSPDGRPALVPLSFEWDGVTMLLATSSETVTGRNLVDGGPVRIALGLVRDVCMIDGEVEVLAMHAVSSERGDRFAARTGFDPRRLSAAYRWYRVRPTRVQAWREENELVGRTLMRDGRWLDTE